MRRSRSAAAYRRVTVAEIAELLGVSRTRALKLLSRYGLLLGDGLRISVRKGRPITYDADVVEKLRHVLGQVHDPLESPETDWLSRYIGGSQDNESQ